MQCDNAVVARLDAEAGDSVVLLCSFDLIEERVDHDVADQMCLSRGLPLSDQVLHSGGFGDEEAIGNGVSDAPV